MLSRQRISNLSIIDYDTDERRVISVTPFREETASTRFFNGTTAIVHADCPHGLPQTRLHPYLAEENDSPVELMFFHTDGLPCDAPFI